MKLSTHVLAILGLAVAFWSVGCGAESVEPPISVAKQPDHYEHGIGRIFDGAATASIEERSFLADTIVKARFVSAGDGVLRFQSIQYLKGTGPTKFSVKAETEGRDTRWDNQDAVLFLVLLTGESEDFKFLDSTTWHYLDEQFVATGYAGALPEGYTLGTQNPVWLPVTSSSSTSSTQVRASVGASSGKTIITEYEASGALAIVTETELQKTISWASAGPPKNAGGGAATTRNNAEESYVANFANCVGASLMQIRHERDWEAYYGVSRFPGQIDREMKAGIGRGVVVDSTSHYRPYRGIRFNRVELDGQDANLFEVRFIDDDNNPLNTDSDLLGSYAHEVLTRRPLPAGDYTYNVLTYLYFLEPCGFRNTKQEKLNTGFYVVFNVTATTSADVVHEAFFDPATTTAGVGYLAGSATTTGVLEPAGFSVRGRDYRHHRPGVAQRAGGADAGPVRVSWLGRFQLHRAGRDCRSVRFPVAEVDATKDWTEGRTADVGGIGAAVGVRGRADDADGADTAAGGAESDSGGELCRGGGIEVGSGIQGGGKRVQDMASPAGEGRGAEDLCIGHAEHGYDVHGREQPRSQPDGVQGAGDRQGVQRRGEFRVCTGRQPVGRGHVRASRPGGRLPGRAPASADHTRPAPSHTGHSVHHRRRRNVRGPIAFVSFRARSSSMSFRAGAEPRNPKRLFSAHVTSPKCNRILGGPHSQAACGLKCLPATDSWTGALLTAEGVRGDTSTCRGSRVLPWKSLWRRAPSAARGWLICLPMTRCRHETW